MSDVTPEAFPGRRGANSAGRPATRSSAPARGRSNIWALADFLAKLPAGTFEREALLLPAAVAAVEDIRFYETTCRDRGLDVRVFADRDEALAWLVA